MVLFHSYVSLPEGNLREHQQPMFQRVKTKRVKSRPTAWCWITLITDRPTQLLIFHPPEKKKKKTIMGNSCQQWKNMRYLMKSEKYWDILWEYENGISLFFGDLMIIDGMEFTNNMIGVVSENEIHPPNGKFDRENMIDSGIVGFPIWKQLYKKWIKLWLYIWRYMALCKNRVLKSHGV